VREAVAENCLTAVCHAQNIGKWSLPFRVSSVEHDFRPSAYESGLAYFTGPTRIFDDSILQVHDAPPIAFRCEIGCRSRAHKIFRERMLDNPAQSAIKSNAQRQEGLASCSLSSLSRIAFPANLSAISFSPRSSMARALPDCGSKSRRCVCLSFVEVTISYSAEWRNPPSQFYRDAERSGSCPAV
jgi:hypothetical protein